jgi:hypothetical protein
VHGQEEDRARHHVHAEDERDQKRDAELAAQAGHRAEKHADRDGE